MNIQVTTTTGDGILSSGSTIPKMLGHPESLGDIVAADWSHSSSSNKKKQCKVEAVQSLVGEADRANRRDIEWMCEKLKEYQRQIEPEQFNEISLLQQTRRKMIQDREAVAIAKEFWLETCERKLYWLNLRKLTNEPPGWGHFESAIQMLDNHQSLPFDIFSPISDDCGKGQDYPLAHVGHCFRQARKTRVYTVYKLLLFYAINVAALAVQEQQEEEKKEQDFGTCSLLMTRACIVASVLENTQYIYPITLPPVLDSKLSDCWLYHHMGNNNNVNNNNVNNVNNNNGQSILLIPNSGYVFGGQVRAQAPYNRGLDCTSFTGWITGCGRPLTYLYEKAWKRKMGVEVDVKPEDEEMVNLLVERHTVVETRGSAMQPGDILVWRHPQGGGHAMFVQKVVDDKSILTVECTNYKDGHYEGYQERVVPIQNPNEGGREGVMRPNHQEAAYLTFRERCQRRATLDL